MFLIPTGTWHREGQRGQTQSSRLCLQGLSKMLTQGVSIMKNTPPSHKTPSTSTHCRVLLMAKVAWLFPSWKEVKEV